MLKIDDKLTFEVAEARLEEITTLLNNADTSLEEVIGLVEEANKLSAFCIEKLQNAKAKITELEK